VNPKPVAARVTATHTVSARSDGIVIKRAVVMSFATAALVCFVGCESWASTEAIAETPADRTGDQGTGSAVPGAKGAASADPESYRVPCAAGYVGSRRKLQPEQAERGRHLTASPIERPFWFEPYGNGANGARRFVARADGYTAIVDGHGVAVAVSAPENAALHGDSGIYRTTISDPARSFYGFDGLRRNAQMIRWQARRLGLFVSPQSGPLGEGRETECFVRLRLDGASQIAQPEVEPLPGKSHYFIGRDPAGWRRAVPNYAKLRYAEVYPGVDVIYYGNAGRLEADFVVKPGADPRKIRFAIEPQLSAPSSGQVRIERRTLTIPCGAGSLRMHLPRIYQGGDLDPVEVAGGHLQLAGGMVGFDVGSYDADDAEHPLVIDPILSYATFLGGSREDRAWAIAVDDAGNGYVLSETTSTDFPGGPVRPASLVVTKLNPAGDAILYSAHLGGLGANTGLDLSVDEHRQIYVAGLTNAPDFPVTPDALQPSHGGGFDGFIVKLSSEGELVYASYVGGRGSDSTTAVDTTTDAVYVTGYSTSADLPTRISGAPRWFGEAHAYTFVLRLDPGDLQLASATFLGGSGDDTARGLAVDVDNNVFLAGYTNSRDLPTVRARQPVYGGGLFDVFVVKFSGTLDVEYLTYLGGRGDDRPGLHGLTVDQCGDVYLTGRTSSDDFPTRNAFQPTFAGGVEDAFVVKLDGRTANIIYSTYLGGSAGHFDIGVGIAVDADGRAHVVGTTSAEDFPSVQPLQPLPGGGFSDGFVAGLDRTGRRLLYSTFLGGSYSDEALGIAIDSSGVLLVAGATSSADLPAINALQDEYGGGASDGFVWQIIPEDGGWCAGDCNGDGMVSVVELVQAVNILLGRLSLAECEALDPNRTGAVTVVDLIEAIQVALEGCGCTLDGGAGGRE
jgi:hypothetical protein